MFERFTERARQVVVLAQDEARLLKHNYIGTEHILLGPVRENEGVAAPILLDFDAERMRKRFVTRSSACSPAPGRGATEPAIAPPEAGWMEYGPQREPPQAPGTSTLALLIAAIVGASIFGGGLLIGWAIWG